MRKLLAFQGSTDNQECPQTSAGWDGLIFGPNFADAALSGRDHRRLRLCVT
jgi:hypothetical protein